MSDQEQLNADELASSEEARDISKTVDANNNMEREFQGGEDSLGNYFLSDEFRNGT